MSGYQRINFKDQNVERPKTYEVTNNPDGSITLIESFGNVEELGTPINQENMNHIEDGIDAVSFSKFSQDLTYKKDDLVTYIKDDELKIFRSLKENNFGHLPSESDYWKEIEFLGANIDLSNLSNTGQEVINAKLNTNLSNITDTSKATITSWGFPASRYTELTLGASDSSYTAPADGWYVFGKSATSAGQYFVLSNASSGLLVAQQATQTSTYIANYIKARKGQRVAVGYTLGGATRFFGFVEAQGEV